MFFVNLVKKKNVFGTEIHLQRRPFEQAQRCFFYFRKLPTIFVNSLDVFGLCANSAFEEKMEVKLIYFWKDGEFITNEFTNMMMMFFDRRRCMLQRQSS